MTKATFEEISGMVFSDEARERLVIKQLMSFRCPRCISETKIKQQTSLSDIEQKIYNKFIHRPHLCGLNAA